MEGYLKKWINPILQWKDRYFILHQDCLIYSETQGAEKKGTIHLKIADIVQVPDDPSKIIINSGTKQIEVRAPNLDLKVKWYNALKDAQIRAQREFDEMSLDQLKENTISNKNLDPKYKRMLLDSNQEKIEQQLIEAYEAGARFDEILSDLLPMIAKNPAITKLVDGLQTEAHTIKHNVLAQGRIFPQPTPKYSQRKQKFTDKEKEKQFFRTCQKTNLKECLLTIESERKRLFRASQVIANEIEGNFNEDRYTRSYYRKDTEEQKFLDCNDDDGTEFQSIMEDDYFYKEQQSALILEEFNNEQNQPKNEIGSGQISLISYFSKACPIRYRLLTQNPSYKASEISELPTRLTLPKQQDPNEKINMWSVFREAIGQDLSKFAVPGK